MSELRRGHTSGPVAVRELLHAALSHQLVLRVQLARPAEKRPAYAVAELVTGLSALAHVAVGASPSRSVDAKPAWPIATELEEVVEVNEAQRLEVAEERA